MMALPRALYILGLSLVAKDP